jgi:hypothetical protein
MTQTKWLTTMPVARIRQEGGWLIQPTTCGPGVCAQSELSMRKRVGFVWVCPSRSRWHMPIEHMYMSQEHAYEYTPRDPHAKLLRVRGLVTPWREDMDGKRRTVWALFRIDHLLLMTYGAEHALSDPTFHHMPTHHPTRLECSVPLLPPPPPATSWFDEDVTRWMESEN